MTVRMKKIRLFGEGVFSNSPIITRQRRLNCYLEVRKDKDKSAVVCLGTPGMRFNFNPATPANQPMRGMVGNDTALYIVASNQVKRLNSVGGTLVQNNVGTVAGLVGMALNPTQLMIVDGVNGYVFNPTSGAITTVGGGFPAGAKTVAYCNGFFIAELPGTNQFFVSNFNDGTTWSGLAFGSAVQAIDGIAAIDTLGGLLIIFSAGHVEFWQNVGATVEPFQYIQNSASMYGLEAINSRVHVGDTLYFICHTGGGSFQNSAGSFQVARIKGYSVSIASTTDIDNILQSMAATSTIQDATGFSYQKDEHIFVQFNFPTANRSLLLDTATGFWSEAQSGITTGYAARHIGNLSTNAFNQQLISDFNSGNIYVPDPTVFTDNGNTIVREVVTPCAMEEYNTIRLSQIYLDMRVGTGLPVLPGATGYRPVVELSLARDNRDFGVTRRVSLGQLGQFYTRVNTRRWGRARMANLRIRMTDAAPFEIAGGAVVSSQRAGRQGPRTQGRVAA